MPPSSPRICNSIGSDKENGHKNHAETRCLHIRSGEIIEIALAIHSCTDAIYRHQLRNIFDRLHLWEAFLPGNHSRAVAPDVKFSTLDIGRYIKPAIALLPSCFRTDNI